jgi:hypothetical protein
MWLNCRLSYFGSSSLPGSRVEQRKVTVADPNFDPVSDYENESNPGIAIREYNTKNSFHIPIFDHQIREKELPFREYPSVMDGS